MSTNPPVLDLRSDTVTRPTVAMRRAMAEAEVGDDVLQDDPTTNRFEAAVAERLGKERALYFPSGTMANQTAIWVLSTPGTEIYVDAESHVVHSEVAGAAALCGVQVRPVMASGLVMNAADLEAHVRTPTADAPEASLVAMENTHNGAGGVVTPLEELRAIQQVARRLGLPMHLDGARLWNAAVASRTPIEQFAACADTVMVSFSKGLGAPVGACLAGPADVIARARRVRKRFGGGMRQSGVLTAAAHHALTHHFDRLVDDHDAAKVFAQQVDGVGGARVVPPHTNIVMIDLPVPRAAAVVARAAERGVRIGQWHPSRVRAVMHLDVPPEAVRAAGDTLAQVLAEVLA